VGLNSVETVLWAENEFGLEIPDADASEMKTVGDFSKYIHQRLLARDGFNTQSEARIFERIKTYLISHVGVRPELISCKAEFVRDLGLD